MGKKWGEGNFSRLWDSDANKDFAGGFQACFPAAQGNHIKHIWKISFKVTVQGSIKFHLDLNTTHIHLTNRPRLQGTF